MDSLKDKKISYSILSNMKKSRSMNNAERSLNASTSRLLDQHLEFVPASSSSLQHNSLKNKYKPINTTSLHNKQESNEINKKAIEICPSEKIVLCWPSSSNKVASGLKNLGNTCFLNSTLQCLLHTPPLYNYLVSKHHKCQLNTFCMACALKNLISIAFGSNDPSSPTLILQNIRFIAKHMKWGRQEDAHEFLRYVIDALHQTDLIGYEKLDASSKETTMPYQIFAGYLKSIVLCLKCNNKSEKLDPFLDICLDIQNVQDVIAGLKKFVSPDMLGGDNMYHCLHCKSKTNAQKYFKFHKLPNVFTIQLKRYLMNGNKISRHVSFPEVLNLSPFMLPEKDNNMMNTNSSNTYKLYSVLVHEGSSRNSGHYYCYVRGPNNLWYCMNDSHVSQTSLQNILRAQAYLLFYLRECTANRGKNDSAYNKSSVNTIPSQLNSTLTMPNNSGIQKLSSNSLNKLVCSKYIPNSNGIHFKTADNIRYTASQNSSTNIKNSENSGTKNDLNIFKKHINSFQNDKNLLIGSSLSNKENMIDNITKQNIKEISKNNVNLKNLNYNHEGQINSSYNAIDTQKNGLLEINDLTKSDNLKLSPNIEKKLELNYHNLSKNDTQIFEFTKNDSKVELLSPKFSKITSFSNQEEFTDKDKFKIFNKKIEVGETNTDVLKKQNLIKLKNSNLELKELSNVKEDFKIYDIKLDKKKDKKMMILNTSVSSEALILDKDFDKSLKDPEKITSISNDRLKNDINHISQETPFKYEKLEKDLTKMQIILPKYNQLRQSNTEEILSSNKRKLSSENIEIEHKKKKLINMNEENKINLSSKISNKQYFRQSQSQVDKISKKKLKKLRLKPEDILKNQRFIAIKDNIFDVYQSSDEIKVRKDDNYIFQNSEEPKKLTEIFSKDKIKNKKHKQKHKQDNILKNHPVNIDLDTQANINKETMVIPFHKIKDKNVYNSCNNVKKNSVKNKDDSKDTFFTSTPIEIQNKKFIKLSDLKKQKFIKKLAKLKLLQKNLAASDGVNSLTKWHVVSFPIQQITNFNENINENTNFDNGCKKIKDLNNLQLSKSECPTFKWDTNVSVNYKSISFKKNSNPLPSCKKNICDEKGIKDVDVANFLKNQSKTFGCEVKTWNDEVNSFDTLAEQENKMMTKRNKFDDLDEEIDQGRTKKKKKKQVIREKKGNDFQKFQNIVNNDKFAPIYK